MHGKEQQAGLLTGGPVQQRRRARADERNFAQRCMHAVWNPHAGTVLGRTGISWVEIIIFYIVFYCFLLAFWSVCLAGFVYTLDDDAPRFYGKGTIVGINPGMGYQPWIKDDPESTLIHIKLGDSGTYGKYVAKLDAYLARYTDINKTRTCIGDDSNLDSSPAACRFDTQSQLGPCAPSVTGDQYGYASGQPCVVLALNRLLGWRPVRYPDDSAPGAVAGRYKPEDIAVYCHGKSAADEEHILEAQYYPPSGIPGKYYPYKVMANYHQPIAAVKFTNIKRNVVVQVECLAYAYNIVHDAEDRQGLIHFELFVEDS